jgi:hypothetical protein
VQETTILTWKGDSDKNEFISDLESADNKSSSPCQHLIGPIETSVFITTSSAYR